LDEILDSSYLFGRMKDFSMGKITENIRHGVITDRKESFETTHFSVVDQDRNAVAVTTTLNGSFGSKVIVAGSGFFLNNEMDDFSIKPGHPNLFGLTGSKANSIEPGKRMLSSMTPTIMEKDGNLFLVLGSPGGSRIITSVFQTILNVVDFNMSLGKAVSSGRFHHQGYPDLLYFEKNRINPFNMEKLNKMKYTLQEVETIGSVNAIIVKKDKLEGTADVRGDNSASGY
jgi:gamma-glutamyltranspeptidase / glutathione hydrolase